MALLQRKVVNPGGLNVRLRPGTAGALVTKLNEGATVGLIDGYSARAGDYDWGIVQLPDQRLAYAALSIGGKATLAEVTTPVPATTAGYGLHVMPGGASNQVLALAQELKAQGKPLACVTVVNDPGLANALADHVKYVLYRNVPGDGNPDNPTPAQFESGQGGVWLSNLLPRYAGLDSRVYIQPANECEWHPKDGLFWRKAMEYADSVGRKLAIFADAVGNPNDQGFTAVYKWQQRIPALEYAKAHNHIVSMHVYSAPGTPAGQLTAENNRVNFEGRFARLYNSVPENARPLLVISELASEFYTGAFQGIDECVNYAKSFLSYARAYPYLIGVCLWTVGVWKQSSIDPALPKLKELFAGRLLQ